MATSQPLLAATIRILRPLARILIRNGVPYAVFSELARWVFVDEATQSFPVEGRKQTTSRVSVLTGLSRKEVGRLRKMPSPEDEATVERHHRAARIVSAWWHDPAFLDETGSPAPLPFEGDRGSFHALVAKYGGDVPPRAVLDELSRVGTVERGPDGTVRLLQRAYLPDGLDAEQERLAILGADTAALIETIDHNLTSPPDQRYFQRKVAYRGVPVWAVAGIRDYGALRAQTLLEDLDRMLSASIENRGSRNARRDKPTRKVMLGIYWHEAEGDEPETQIEGRNRAGERG